MKKNFTSIILQCFDFNKALRHMTMAALANFRKYTPEGVYELIVVDNSPKFPIRDEYEVLNLKKVIVNEEDKGCFPSYNQGAKIAEGDVLVFTQNDVFVHEGWLENMRHYIDNDIADAVYPDQGPKSREYVLKSYKLPHEEAMFGWRDAGMLMITKEGFDKTGGWDERIKASIVGWKLMIEAIDGAGLRQIVTCKTIVTHIRAGTNLIKDDELYNKELEEENRILNQ